MATDERDRINTAWSRLKKAVNTQLPDYADRLAAVRGKTGSGGGSGPRPS